MFSLSDLYIGKQWPHNLVSIFSTDQINLSDLGRGSPKNHLYQFIFKLPWRSSF